MQVDAYVGGRDALAQRRRQLVIGIVAGEVKLDLVNARQLDGKAGGVLRIMPGDERDSQRFVLAWSGSALRISRADRKPSAASLGAASAAKVIVICELPDRIATCGAALDRC